MTGSEDTLKKLSVTALVVMGILFIAGVVWYRERLFFCDAAYIAFNILRYGRLFIQEHRYGSFITQAVPYFGAKLHLPLGIILKGYAFSFNCFYMLAGIIVYKCRQYGLLLIMALCYTLLVSDTWYWTNNEIHQAIAWLFIFYAVTLRMGALRVSRWYLIPVFILLAFITVSTHFIIVIPLLFLWVYLWLQGAGWPWDRQNSIILTVILAAIIPLKLCIVSTNSYDHAHLHNVTHFSLSDVGNAAKASVVKWFAYRLFTIYWLAPLVLATGLFALIKARRKWLFIWVFASFIGYILVMGLTYTNDYGNILLFHIESEWECIAVILAAPFVFSFLPLLNARYAALLLAFIFLTRLGYIAASSQKFTSRVQLTEQMLASMRKKGIHKLLLAPDSALQSKYIQSWALTEESTLMSALAGDKPQLTFCFAKGVKEDSALWGHKSIFTSFPAGNERVSYQYIQTDTIHYYLLMSYAP